MRRCSLLFGALLLVGGACAPAMHAQVMPEPAAPGSRRTAPLPALGVDPTEPTTIDRVQQERRFRRDIVRIGNDFVLPADDGVGDITTVVGDARIDGRVDGDVVVVLGHADLSATALIGGSLVVVAGSVTVADGARLGRDLVMVGGRFDGPPTFAPGGDYILLGPQAFGERFSGAFEWFSRGVLWGRLIVPGLWWVWLVVIVFYFVYLLLGVMFEKPVREITETLEARPVTTLVVGFLVTLIVGPVCVLLAVSVVGIAVIPLVVVGLCAAWVLGKIGTARWIGRTVAGPAVSPRADMVRNFSVGFAIVCLAYLVPILGVLTWALLSVFSLGACTLAFVAAYRRESPAIPRTARATPTPASRAAMSAPELSMHPVVEMPEAREAVSEEVPGVRSSVGPNDLASFPKASFRDRIAAGVLDLILLLIVVNSFDHLFDDNRGFAFALAYFVGAWAWRGATLGGVICQMRVVRVDNQPIRFVDALVRGLSGIFSLMVLGLGFLWILRDVDRQAWHDRIAGTYVVKVPKDWRL